MPRKPIEITAIIFVLTCTPAAPAKAIAPCPRPPAAAVMFPQQGATVPRNVVIFLYRQKNANLILREKKTGRQVPYRLVAQPGKLAVRMIPKRTLRPNTTYEIRGFHNSQSKQRYTMTTFTTTALISRTARPTFKSTRVKFTRHFKPRHFRHVMVQAGGRKAILFSKPAGTKPAVVELNVRFKNPRGGLILSRLFHPWRSPLYFGSRSACWSMLPAVFRSGTYTVQVTPWSATGKKGPTVVLKGRIK
jgi:hypothetical protein